MRMRARLSPAGDRPSDLRGPSPILVYMAGRVWPAILAAGVLLAPAIDGSQDTARAAPPLPQIHRLSIEIRDAEGSPAPVRIRVYGSDGHAHPDTIDAARLTHGLGGGYFYADGSAWVNVPPGVTRITLGRGFEWRPIDLWCNVHSDTTLQLVLERFVDLGAQGWYGGEIHAHALHGDIDYYITPMAARFVTRCEGLSVIHFLDQSNQFTGTPHPLSDAETILYYTYEFRNQVYGHVPLPGLRQRPNAEGCGYPGDAPFPMILDLREEIIPLKGPMIVLGHPHTTDDYFYDEDWPGWGLGREMPVLAAFGKLDAMDVVSYSNTPDEDWSEWYDLLSSGCRVPPSAGTDALLNQYSSYPPGGWRVYASLGAGVPLTYDAWLDAYRAGHTFITNYPLIPEFRISGFAPGEVLECPADTLDAVVHMSALCALGLRRVAIVADGREIWTKDYPGVLPTRFAVDTTFTLHVPTPGWLHARVLGIPSNPHAILGLPIAHTNAIRITREGLPILRTLSAARWCDQLDSLKKFVDLRGHWHGFWERDSIRARIGRAQEYYLRAFVLPPEPFTLLAPAMDDTVYAGSLYLDWLAARDPELGDDVDYTLRLSEDSTFTFARVFHLENPGLGGINIAADRWYWWSVDAFDRAGNTTTSTPPVMKFYLARDPAVVSELGSPATTRPGCRPNPSRGHVLLEGFAEPAEIFDLTGRRIIRVWTRAPGQNSGAWIWDGRTAEGITAAPGVYWVRGRGSDQSLRVIRIPGR